MKYISLIIITAFIFICLFFGLNKKDQNLKSPLLNKPIPEINLNSLKNDKLNKNNFKNEIILVNFFASWCVPCIVEHNFLFELKKQKPIKIKHGRYCIQHWCGMLIINLASQWRVNEA